ncbi:MAG: DNA polymerase III subunit gamma/tau [Lacipirellulaceae bacterium]
MDDAPPLPSGVREPGHEYVVVARRYRPQAFAELIGQEHVAGALEQAIRTGRIGHAYLFCGARGVGKTSAARIFAKALNCVEGPTPTPCNRCDVCQSVAAGDDVDVLEIDGASNRGIDEIRQLRQNAGIRPSRVRFKVYIIDEVHMLTKEAFNALLKTLEEPPEHVKFVFATTEPNKIPITILSRCQRFDFAGIEAVSIRERLAQIAEAEGVEVEPEALALIAARAAGSMRDSQSLLEQLLAVAGGRITADGVNSLLGIAPAERVAELAERLAERDAAGALTLVDGAIGGGADVAQLVDQLMGYYRDAMALAVGCSPERMLYALPAQVEAARELGARLGVPTLLAALQVLDQTAARMRVSVHERTLLEMAIVRLATIADLEGLAELAAELRSGAALPAAAPPRPAMSARSTSRVTPAAPPAAPPAPAPPAKPIAPAAAPVAQKPRRAPIDVNAALASVEEAEELPPVAPRPTPQPAPTAASGDGIDMMSALQAQLAKGPAAAAGPVGSRRVARRQQQAEIAQVPLVKRAMELFDADPDRVRYTPPPGAAGGTADRHG